MNDYLKKYKTKLILFLIILVQVMAVLSFAAKKEGYFIDEVLTFSLANREVTGYFDTPVHEWIDKEWYLSNMTAQEWTRFNFDIAYQNQVQDVSPPLFYMMIHGACSFFPGQLSHWMGIGLNLIFYVGCVILLYLLGKKVFQDEKAGLLIAGVFGITYGAINSAIFIRMYMMATFWLLAHLSVYIHYFEQKKIPKRGYVLLGVTAVLGCLTQYYFLIGAAFLGMWYGVKFLYQKRYLDIVKYGAAVAISAVSAYMIFPAMVDHILKSGRGTAAFDSLAENSSYLKTIKENFGILNTQMFDGKMLLLVMVLLLLGIWIAVKKKKITAFVPAYWIPITIVCIGYFLAVTKVAPYQTDRYIMPTYPLIYFLVIGVAYGLLSDLFEKKVVVVICAFLFGGIAISQLSGASFHYLYEGYNKRNVAQEYVDENCVVLSEDHGYWYYDTQALIQYQSFFWLRDTEDEAYVIKMKERIVPEEKFVMYVRNTWTEEQLEAFWAKNFGSDWSYELYEECNTERYMVYHCKMN